MARAADAGGAGAAVTLRPGQPADAPALAQIHRAAREAALPGLREPWGEAAVAAWLRDTLLARHRVWVAVAAGSAIAYLGLAGTELLHLYVAPGFQRRGIGGRLLAGAIAAAPGGLALYAFERNHAARRFYERHGFRGAERRPASANEEGSRTSATSSPHAKSHLSEEREP
ncbi:GNAT family N-acetyltransferase [Dankookia sp. P2]|uniref:GNAT family N-acetyltransferase n=1 Tax=Dankookia sp. P2 TaxID=3423955 RepID=UPI003D67A3F5